jgi:hypothetical protein
MNVFLARSWPSSRLVGVLVLIVRLRHLAAYEFPFSKNLLKIYGPFDFKKQGGGLARWFHVEHSPFLFWAKLIV